MSIENINKIFFAKTYNYDKKNFFRVLHIQTKGQLMKINYNNAQNHPDFKANIRIKGGIDLMNELTQKILPEYSKKNRKNEIDVFVPDYLFRDKKYEFFASEAVRMGYSPHWLEKNANLHGINTDLSSYGEIFIFTGKDVADFRKTTVLDSYHDDIYMLKALEFASKKPEHLRPLALITQRLTYFQNLFDNFIKDKKFISVDNLTELKKELFKSAD